MKPPGAKCLIADLAALYLEKAPSIKMASYYFRAMVVSLIEKGAACDERKRRVTFDGSILPRMSVNHFSEVSTAVMV